MGYFWLTLYVLSFFRSLIFSCSQLLLVIVVQDQIDATFVYDFVLYCVVNVVYYVIYIFFFFVFRN
jgi:hypothetical protein